MWRTCLYFVGLLLLFLGAVMTVTLPFAWYHHAGDLKGLLLSIATTLVAGGVALAAGFRHRNRDIRPREGYLVVFLAWCAFGLFGALPYLFTGSVPGIADALFESISGFTTTGSTILTDIEAVPPGILFWRCLTQWLGGMGIIVLTLAVLPFLGAGGQVLFKTEVPGPTAEKLTPRIAATAKILSTVYLLLTALVAVLLLLGGMNLEEALCHAFATVSTGGFSTRNASVGAYHSGYIDLIVIVFMIVSATNFGLHYRFFKGEFSVYFKNRECQLFIGVIGIASLLLLLDPAVRAGGILHGARDALFQASSIATTSGFGTADYEGWSGASQIVLLLLMFMGGCAGSTSGGIKVVRVVLLMKIVLAEMTRLLHPRAVVQMRMGDSPVPKEAINNLAGFFILFTATYCIGVLLLAFAGLDPLSAMSASIAALGNIGPGLGTVGPTDNFAHLPAFGKYVFSALMLMGRLELFAVIIFLSPEFWRK